jgi:hypothetical protein
VPPVQALASLHGFWALVAGAAVTGALRRLSARQLRVLGSAVAVTAGLGLLVFLGRDLSRWLGAVPPELHRYALQRVLFAVGTNSDVPLVQVIAAGAVCWVVGALREKRAGPSAPAARLRKVGSGGAGDGAALGPPWQQRQNAIKELLEAAAADD